MAEDYSIDKAITLFQNKKNKEQIFHKNTFKDGYFQVDYLDLLNAGYGPKYSTTKKKEAFENLFPEIDKVQMNELPKLIGKEPLGIVVCT